MQYTNVKIKHRNNIAGEANSITVSFICYLFIFVGLGFLIDFNFDALWHKQKNYGYNKSRT